MDKPQESPWQVSTDCSSQASCGRVMWTICGNELVLSAPPLPDVQSSVVCIQHIARLCSLHVTQKQQAFVYTKAA